MKDASALTYAATPLADTVFYANGNTTPTLTAPTDITGVYATDGYALSSSGLTIVGKAIIASSPGFFLGWRTSKSNTAGTPLYCQWVQSSQWGFYATWGSTTSQPYQGSSYNTTADFTYITKLDQAGSRVIYEIYNDSNNLTNQKIVTGVTMTANSN